VQLPAHDAHEIEDYLAQIREAGLRVEDVEIRKADLEDVFLDVMSEKGAAGAARPPEGADTAARSAEVS
jgi:ABC-2 type transport system ATP-binding protein